MGDGVKRCNTRRGPSANRCTLDADHTGAHDYPMSEPECRSVARVIERDDCQGWQGVPFAGPNGQPGWEVNGWAHPELVDRLEKLEGTATNERLCVLEQADDCDSCQAQIDALNAKIYELGQRPTLPGPELIAALRANGVTRYKAGDVEIELGAAPSLAQELTEPGRALALARALGQHREALAVAGKDDHAEQLRLVTLYPAELARERIDDERAKVGTVAHPYPCPRCRKPMFWDDSTSFLRCTSCGAKSPAPDGPITAPPYVPPSPAQGADPPQPPVDEQPPVEIDMPAVEELLREQDEKRRGPSSQ